jgi:hypothetical protein
MEQQIQQWHRGNEASQKLAAVPGIGAITVTANGGVGGRREEFSIAYCAPRSGSNGEGDGLYGGFFNLPLSP